MFNLLFCSIYSNTTGTMNLEHDAGESGRVLESAEPLDGFF